MGALEALKTFARGGVHPPEAKAPTEQLAIEELPLPKSVFIPLQQHIGAPAKAVVKKKDEVLAGQLIGESGGFVSAPVHASVAGVVKNVAEVPTSYGPRSLAVEITVAEEQAWAEGILEAPLAELPTTDPKELKDRLQAAGLVGMGGAAFPTHVKLSPPPSEKIDTLILNGAECEPYLTADHRLMLEHARQIALGADVMRRILGLETVHVGIEANKPDAVQAFEALRGELPWLQVHGLKVKYPQGAEKQLIKAIVGREVPSAKLPLHVGCVVQNVGTAFAAYEALYLNKPLVERVLTLSGAAITRPANLRARIGTPLSHVAAQCGGPTDDLSKLVFGGPMMGKAVRSLDLPVLKNTSGVLFLTAAEAPVLDEEDCIRCGMCVTACPQGLTPCDLATHAEFEQVAGLTDLFDCVECGSCNFICPARRRLVQWIRLGKSTLRALQQEEKNG